jgi:cellobiose-specific phosphotransferase system component IIA
MPRIRNWKLEMGRVVTAGLGSVVALTIAGWPGDAALAAWVGLAGAVIGLVVAFAVEYVGRLRAEVRRLQHIEQTNTTERQLRKRERELWEYQVQLARREAAIAEAHSKVYGDVVVELARSGKTEVSLAVIMARIDNLMTARNLKHPLKPPGQQHHTRAA